ETLIECTYRKRIALYRAYEETNLIKHLQAGCNLKNKQPRITSFFKYSNILDDSSKPNEWDESDE
ncbi:95_t:CDS:1, partial [Funneliformis geosporum]